MSRQQTFTPYGFSQPVRILHEYLIAEIEGQVLTFIESLGLSPGQEKAAKDMFRTIYYRIYNETDLADGVLARISHTPTPKFRGLVHLGVLL